MFGTSEPEDYGTSVHESFPRGAINVPGAGESCFLDVERSEGNNGPNRSDPNSDSRGAHGPDDRGLHTKIGGMSDDLQVHIDNAAPFRDTDARLRTLGLGAFGIGGTAKIPHQVTGTRPGVEEHDQSCAVSDWAAGVRTATDTPPELSVSTLVPSAAASRTRSSHPQAVVLETEGDCDVDGSRPVSDDANSATHAVRALHRSPSHQQLTGVCRV